MSLSPCLPAVALAKAGAVSRFTRQLCQFSATAARSTPLSGTVAHPPGGYRAQGSGMEGIIKAWGKILTGYQPNLSIEITRECPLTCPGCYAYGSDHLGGDVTLRELQ